MKTKLFTFLSAALLCSSVTADVYAGELARCVKRMLPARSSVAVQAEGVKPGAIYTSVIRSGARTASSIRNANPLGTVKFSYDSNKKDIQAGKKAIHPRFIANDIDVWVYDALGNVVAKKADTVCTIR